MEMDWQETGLGRLVQTGTVTDVSGGRVRVKFPDTEIPSGWLAVIAAPCTVEVGETAGGQGEGAFESHAHPARVRPWPPKITDRGLELYLPVPGGAGFVIGGI